MSAVVNLNRFRKKRTRVEKEKRAEENRARHGRTKMGKAKEKAENASFEKHLDKHKIED